MKNSTPPTYKLGYSLRYGYLQCVLVAVKLHFHQFLDFKDKIEAYFRLIRLQASWRGCVKKFGFEVSRRLLLGGPLAEIPPAQLRG